MQLAFVMIAVLVLGSAAAAMLLRNLIHCVLCLTLTFAGMAAVYLQLGAEFVGFAQILVYVGAVAILVVFAILLTRGDESPGGSALAQPSWLVGISIAALVFGCLALSIAASTIPRVAPSASEATVRQLGQALMTRYVLPLEVLGLLLTAAMMGAVVLALPEKDEPPTDADAGNETGPPP